MIGSTSTRAISTTLILLLLLASLCLAQQQQHKATSSMIKRGQQINVNDTIVSPKQGFVLGFFSPQNSTNRYVGIWFNNMSKPSYVWVANRDYPVLTPSAVLTVRSDGNIAISDGKMSYMVTNMTSNSTSKDRYAMLLDSGNLVLRADAKPGTDLWQSFDYPTDTLLPGMKFGNRSLPLVSWKSGDNPAPGKYSLRLDSVNKELIINKGNETRWVCDQTKDGLLFGMVLDNGHLRFDHKRDISVFSRLILRETGQLELQSWNEKKQDWVDKEEHKPDRADAEDENAQYGEAKKDRTRLNIILALIALLAAVTIAMLVLIAIIIIRRRRLARKGENLLLFDVQMSLKDNSHELPDIDQKGKRGRKKAFKLSFFTFASVSYATDNFSAENKLGEGGFGPVYKGTLIKGGEVAVKRLSEKSRQGTEQFKNEAHLIARLQHKHLVRLLGCCIEKKEKILIYEYLSNKSLDYFLYDSTKRASLKWPMRVKIVEGVVQGLLYLHQYSRIRIVHRDLKPSNILLDNDMNPKITDFGMARIFGGNQSHVNIARPAGTLGYMSPESGQHGLFSEKSDVYSFGVLFLEILSGKKNTDVHNSETRGLVAYAWELWISDRGVDLLDPLIEDAAAMHMIIRYLRIALLCVEENASDRPTMCEVLSMLCNSSRVLPSPKQPGFLKSTTLVKRNAAGTGPEVFSTNEMSLTALEPR